MKSKILIVDDSALARRLTRKLLEELSYAVEDVADGMAALERYALNRHDVVILDMLMHGMYGLQVLVKFQELNPKLPVIIATADIQKTTRDQVKTAGAAGILNKPVNKDELAQVLQTVIAGGNSWN